MVKSSLIVAVIALVASYANAECNNMCSGHGICGANDACTCYRNWRGNDCSERTCQYGIAFVNTAQGDLDHDGKVEATERTVNTQWSPKNTGGTFEMYPDLAAQESHSYMECSNKGLCDRATGNCVCFDGYEGSSCQRTVCPNACSGHGVCRNILDKTQALTTLKKYPYPLWDGLKNQACVCDPGYDGVDCGLRLCPKGSDPLDIEDSNVARVDEIQQIVVNDGSAAIAGTFQLKYTDLFGETWTTSSITADNTDTVGAGVKDALKGIPNSVIEDVTVGAAATGSYGVTYTITFTNNPGDLVQLEAVSALTTGTITITTPTAGTKIASECSNRGLCDYETGLCKCFRGYRLDDCSSQHALAYGSTAASL